MAVCQKFDLEVDDRVIPRIAYCFAGGMGNSGLVCGAVAGGVMAIGLKGGRPDTMEEGFAKLGVAREFCRRFEAEMGSVNCRDLTGADLTTEEGIARFMESDAPARACFPAVGLAYRLAVDVLHE